MVSAAACRAGDHCLVAERDPAHPLNSAYSSGSSTFEKADMIDGSATILTLTLPLTPSTFGCGAGPAAQGLRAPPDWLAPPASTTGPRSALATARRPCEMRSTSWLWYRW